MTIDICIPVYKGVKKRWGIKQTLKSLQRTCDVDYNLIVKTGKGPIVEKRLLCLAESKQPYILWLDDDIQFTCHTWASRMLKRLLSKDNIGVVGVNEMRPNWRKYKPVKQGSARIIFCGCMLTRKIPGIMFDTAYEALGAEDIDYLYQVRAAGYTVYQENRIVIIHHKRLDRERTREWRENKSNPAHKSNVDYFIQKWGCSWN